MIDAIRRALLDYTRHRFLYGVCLFTIALSVFIVSAYSLFFINASSLMSEWQRGMRVMAYLKPDVTAKERISLMEALYKNPGVDRVSYISKADGFEWLKSEIGRQSSLLEGLSENPLPDAIEIRMTDAMNEVAAVGRLVADIRAHPEVQTVEYAQKWLQRFYGIYNLFKLTGMVLIALVFVAILFIVANTIRLIIFSRREEIEITRIIGADEAFIKYPFYMEAILLGFLGGIIGLGVLFAAFEMLMPKLSSGGLLPFFQIQFVSPAMMLFILISIMFVGWLGCYFSIRRFLRV